MLDLLIRNGQLVDGTGALKRIADVGIKDGLIVAVGDIDSAAVREIDAAGLLVTPGFVDIHTHFDGQATWDPYLEPSSTAGVTTAIIGNCGVGFAPVRKGDHQKLIDLMEGVEDIPGTALHEGLKWNWDSFPEYLDVLDTPRALDIGALLPHGPLRRYIMGDKVGTDKCASGYELAEMARLVDDAMEAGAFGISSSRTIVHRTLAGDMTDDFDVDEPELLALVEPVAKHGGYFEVAPYGMGGEDLGGIKSEMRMYDNIIKKTGVTLHMLMMQTFAYPDYCVEQLAWAEQVNSSGRGRAFGQVGGRAQAALLSFYGTNPFMDRSTLLQIKQDFSREEWLTQLAKPDIKAKILAERNAEGGFPEFISTFMSRCYDLGPDHNYEPEQRASVSDMATALGRKTDDLLYDLMLETSDSPRILMATTNYSKGDYGDLAKMLASPATLLSLSDAGAHVQSICDGTMSVFMLTHWVRDRARGDRLPLEVAVRMMTKDNADAIGLHDRGVVAPGYKADINIIDFNQLALGKARFVNDLPAGAWRLTQDVTGIRATIVSGTLTREHDRATGELPGRLVRHKIQTDGAGAGRPDLVQTSV
jgi:N-acyl-D-aspartate/D-glutamate deacylase